jgi:hypothetical protein
MLPGDPVVSRTIKPSLANVGGSLSLPGCVGSGGHRGKAEDEVKVTLSGVPCVGIALEH